MRRFSRRRFLQLSGAGVAFAGRGLAGAAPVVKPAWQVLHTTDLHGHILPTESYAGVKDLGGLARCASQIREWRKQAESSILVDVGDVYQGTLVSWRNRGRLMIDLFNKLGYDAWVLGNHEFDWGPEVVEEALQRSNMPVLAANVKLDGKLVGAERTEGLFRKLRPWIIKEMAGEKVAIIGLITPGLPYWLRQELLGPLEVVDPAPVLKRCLDEVRGEGATRIIVAGHMGWRERGDDFANPLGSTLLGTDTDLYLGGHTHRKVDSWKVGEVTCSQSAYHGLSCGRVVFEDGEPRPELADMTAEVGFDALVMEAAGRELEEARQERERVVGKLEEGLEGRARVREFLCEAFLSAAKKTGQEADLVVHGTFGTDEVPAGDFTVGDAWELLPYENRLVVAELEPEEVAGLAARLHKTASSDRRLFGDKVVFNEDGTVNRFEGVGESRKLKVLFNSYDAQSGGKRLMELRELLEKPSSKSRLLPLETREALIDYVANQ